MGESPTRRRSESSRHVKPWRWRVIWAGCYHTCNTWSLLVCLQCFCFEEQRLNPHEEVDMPVFFYIDPEFDNDPRMARVDTITLSYTFFEAKEGQMLPLPGYSYSWARAPPFSKETKEKTVRIIETLHSVWRHIKSRHWSSNVPTEELCAPEGRSISRKLQHENVQENISFKSKNHRCWRKTNCTW